ncbi:MAG TPA: homocysteine S-methyltransferase family protein [Albidovulum sp.]|uniref:homocysteine S-methyltransferase family protein n=1 Tax=Albidovulum sp. TaxID=1872424 RepID=UPI002CC51A68|nr:homocysteine S-methyltransferase family protein [Albidovulum sp.]
MQSPKLRDLQARMSGKVWLSDGGMETTLIFQDGIDLPHFASFPLLATEAGRESLRRYFAGYLAEARTHGAGFVLGTATWRSGKGWGEIMGLSADDIDAVNRDAVRFARTIAASPEARGLDIVFEGVVGPHGDAYAPDRLLNAAEAEEAHGDQVRSLASAGVDFVTATTIANAAEGIGIARAASKADVPAVVSFTVETDGRLLTGQTLGEAIAETDAATDGGVAWYGVNCAHPDHFRQTLTGSWLGRLGQIRANASRKSHAELDNSTELDAGDAAELARDYRALMGVLPNLRVLGGCCGTDVRHVAAIAGQCAHAAG